VHLRRKLPQQWEWLHSEPEKNFRDVIHFMYKDQYCIRMYDKIKYLEVQIRHYKYYQKESMQPVFASLHQSLDEVQRNGKLQLQYGFICHHSRKKSDHMVVVPTIKDPKSSLDGTDSIFCKQCQLHMDIGKLHKMWFGSNGTFINYAILYVGFFMMIYFTNWL